MVDVASAIATGVIFALVNKGVQKIDSQLNKDGSTDVIVDNRRVTTIKPEIGITSPTLTIKSIKSTETKKPSKPTFEITNNLQLAQKIFDLSFNPDTQARTKASMVITVNGVPMVEVTDKDLNQGSFEPRIPSKGIQWLKNKSVKVFLWNSVDTNQVEIHLMMLTGV